MLVSRNVGIALIACALTVGITSFVIIDIMDSPVPKPLQDPGLLIETDDHKLAKNLVTQVIKKYDKEAV